MVLQIVDYICTGNIGGSFMWALIEGDLYAAVRKADDNNKLILVQLVEWIYAHAPIGSYGSVTKMTDWSTQGGLMGLGGQKAIDKWKLCNGVK